MTTHTAKYSVGRATLCAALLILTLLLLTRPATAADAAAYAQHMAQAQQFLTEKKQPEALDALQKAAQADPARFEPLFIAAALLHQAKEPAARAFAERALALAPADQKARVQQLLAQLPPAPAPTPAPIATATNELTPDQKRKLEVLKLIIEEADQAKDDEAKRKKLLQEFMTKSAEFLASRPAQVNVWVLRAASALELSQTKVAWEAGQKLIALGADKGDDAKAAKVLAMLDRKGLLSEKEPPAAPKAGEKFENSLGMKFVPVAGTDVLFSVWHTRVQDFAAFVKATGHDATAGMFSAGSDGWKQRGDTWEKPGFEQTGLHPVSGVSWEDARAFAKWLTEKERAEGKLGENQSYRLPADWEWSVAVGLNEAREGTPKSKDEQIKDVYPWGNQWPPPAGAGNYAGEGDGVSKPIEGYRDGYPRTSPVGSFAANRFGLYDIGGNLWQWCEDWFDGDQKYRVLRGGAWDNCTPSRLLSSCRDDDQPGYRSDNYGFRLVMVMGVRP